MEVSYLKKSLLLSFLSLCILLTGCSFNTNIVSMLSPPKLSEKQMQIQAALYDAVGNNIQLKYPKSGDMRSAFVIYDLDGDSEEEAMVFYTTTGIDSSADTIRINILDQENGQWKSVFDHSATGTEIDQVIVTNLTSTDYPDIVIGYQQINRNDKVVMVYNYSDGVLKNTYSDSYTYMNTVNLDGDPLYELLACYDQDNIPMAKLISKTDSGLGTTSTIEMSPSGTNYINITNGYFDDNIPAAFIDSDRGENTIQTQIVYTVQGQLRNPIAQIYELTSKTVRPSSYLSYDIDKDGIVEIPLVSPAPGYETSTDQLYFTNWMTYSQFTFNKKNTGFYNIDEGYCFMLPNRWAGVVTVKIDHKTKEVVFYKYEGNLDSDMTELMRIKTMSAEQYSKSSMADYMLISESLGTDYLVKIPNITDEPLVLTYSEILYNFIIV